MWDLTIYPPSRSSALAGTLSIFQSMWDSPIGRSMDTRRSANKDVGSRWGWIEGHIDWRMEQVPARTLDPEDWWIVRSHIDWGGERNIFFIKVWKLYLADNVLKTSGRSSKGKVQRGQYLLAVDLRCYIFCKISFFLSNVVPNLFWLM